MGEIVSYILFTSLFFMIGVIWVVQITVYPAMKWFETHEFGMRHDAYRNKIALIVTGPMFLELLASVYAVVRPFEWLDRTVAIVLLAFLVLIWVSTVVIQVPLHERLSAGKDVDAIESLVRTNWIRTSLWSLRGLIVTTLLLS